MTQLQPRAMRDAVQDAENGRRVIFAAQRQIDARNYFLALRESPLLDEADVSVRATKGSESIRFMQGGRIDFISASGNRARGMWAHKVYAPTTLTDEQHEQIIPCMASVRNGEIIWYTAEPV